MQSTGSKKQAIKSVILPLFLLGSLIALIVFLFIRATKKSQGPEATIRDIMKAAGLSNELIDLFVAQSKHETGNFTSNLCVNYKNLFGMTVPKKRKSTRSGEYFSAAENQSFSVYRNWGDSVRDQLLWIQAVKFPAVVTLDAFIDAMVERGYFEDGADNYKRGMMRFL